MYIAVRHVKLSNCGQEAFCIRLHAIYSIPVALNLSLSVISSSLIICKLCHGVNYSDSVDSVITYFHIPVFGESLKI